MGLNKGQKSVLKTSTMLGKVGVLRLDLSQWDKG